jgi:hypothetical protein
MNFQNPQEIGLRETIVLNGQLLNTTDNFKVLGSIISSEESIHEDNFNKLYITEMKILRWSGRVRLNSKQTHHRQHKSHTYCRKN